MRDYRVPKNIGGFNPQKLYTEILKSDTEERWRRENYGDMTLISNYGALYIVPGKFPLAESLIAEANIKDLVPNWDNGVPCEDTKSEVTFSNPYSSKSVVKVFRMNEEDFYFNKKYFKYFTDDTFEYRMSERGKSLYVAYKGELIAAILGINVSK